MPCDIEMFTPPFEMTLPLAMTHEVPVLSELGRCHESCRKTAGVVDVAGMAMFDSSEDEKRDESHDLDACGTAGAVRSSSSTPDVILSWRDRTYLTISSYCGDWRRCSSASCLLDSKSTQTHRRDLDGPTGCWRSGRRRTRRSRSNLWRSDGGRSTGNKGRRLGRRRRRAVTRGLSQAKNGIAEENQHGLALDRRASLLRHERATTRRRRLLQSRRHRRRSRRQGSSASAAAAPARCTSGIG